MHFLFIFFACSEPSGQLCSNDSKTGTIGTHCKPMPYSRMNQVSLLKVYVATLKLSNQMLKVSERAWRRAVACHARPAHPDLRGQPAGHSVLTYKLKRMAGAYTLTSSLTSCQMSHLRRFWGSYSWRHGWNATTCSMPATLFLTYHCTICELLM